MADATKSKTVQIGPNAFAIRGRRSISGALHFSVVDIDCALEEPEDQIAEQFKAALKHRLERARRKREAELT